MNVIFTFHLPLITNLYYSAILLRKNVGSLLFVLCLIIGLFTAEMFDCGLIISNVQTSILLTENLKIRGNPTV